MTSIEGDYFARLSEQTRRNGHDLSNEFLIAVVVVAWLMVLFAGYLVVNS
jgi:hypothetical protein